MFRRLLFSALSVNPIRFRSMSNDCKVGFIGLGNMGGYMALNLAKKGHYVTVYDLDGNKINDIKKQDSKIDSTSSIKQLAGIPDVKVIITMLPSSPQVIDVYQHSGLLDTVPNGTILIDCTTGDPSVSQEVAKISKTKGSFYIDAPVSGGINAARDGVLTFMVGGDTETVEKSKEFLFKMGKNVFHCGDVGTGLAAKICNNMLLAISMIGVSEAMNLGIKLGLEPSVLAKIINSSSGRCWSSDTYNPVPGIINGVPSSKDYEGGFGVALMTKDLGLSQSAGISKGASIPLGSAAYQVYRLLCDHGLAKKDFSVVYKFLSGK